MSPRTRYFTVSGSRDQTSRSDMEDGRIFETLFGAYDSACDASQSWDGYVLVIREFDNEAASREAIAMFKGGVKLWEENEAQ